MNQLTDRQLLKLYRAVMGIEPEDIEPLSQEEVDRIEAEYVEPRITAERDKRQREFMEELRQEWIDTITDEELVEMGMKIVRKMVREGYGR